MSYNIGIIGTGYVGLVTGTCFAETGNTVYCCDIDESKISKLNNGTCPIYEPGLEHLIKQNVNDERLYFTTDIRSTVKFAPIIFLCLPTPPNEDGSADLQHVLHVAEQIANIIKEEGITDKKIVLNKSTVPVDTAVKVRNIFNSILPVDQVEVASNPEFLREGFAIEDSMKPERIVVGTRSKYVEEIMLDLYSPFVRSGNPIIIMDERSAEITKYAANSFLAIKISFMNDLSQYCEKVGADIEKIRIGIGADSRIGKRFLFAGLGYGGSCFPKDVRALMYSTELVDTPLSIVRAAYNVNHNQQEKFFQKIQNRFEGNLAGRQFVVWGLAFKPNTDDTREAPAFALIEKLLAAGASVSAFDQEAMANTRIHFGDQIKYAKNMYDCIPDADALIVATEWNVFRNPDFKKLKANMKTPIIFDGRNLYELDEMEKLGFEYYCVGRRSVIPKSL
ncbi:MAG: UDP-glucose/GDP-mannose dehydrogenase family protein [Candidatus Kapabacteria bacterium]|nr:UDP-glucose/GDP-mannose dehydrogenase family protein [Candidatus Kapabacteria bacterium]